MQNRLLPCVRQLLHPILIKSSKLLLQARCPAAARYAFSIRLTLRGCGLDLTLHVYQAVTVHLPQLLQSPRRDMGILQDALDIVRLLISQCRTLFQQFTQGSGFLQDLMLKRNRDSFDGNIVLGTDRYHRQILAPTQLGKIIVKRAARIADRLPPHLLRVMDMPQCDVIERIKGRILDLPDPADDRLRVAVLWLYAACQDILMSHEDIAGRCVDLLLRKQQTGCLIIG